MAWVSGFNLCSAAGLKQPLLSLGPAQGSITNMHDIIIGKRQTVFLYGFEIEVKGKRRTRRYLFLLDDG